MHERGFLINIFGFLSLIMYVFVRIINSQNRVNGAVAVLLKFTR
jgi:hypothetical protein